MFFSDFLGFFNFLLYETNLARANFPVHVETNHKIDLILNEAEVEDDDFKLVFSDNEVEEMEGDDSTAAEDEIFIDDSDQEEEDLPQLFNPENREEVNFDSFGGDHGRAAKFKKSFLNLKKSS